MSSINSSNVYDDLDMSDEMDCSIEITTSSFCGDRQTGYVSPLERKQVKRPLSTSDENINLNLSIVTKGRRPSKIIKRSKTTGTKNGVRPIKRLRKSVNVSKSPVAIINKPEIIVNGVENEANDEKYKNNKFFKSRPSEIRRESVSWKSFSLYDTKTFNSLYKKNKIKIRNDSSKNILRSMENKNNSILKNVSFPVIGSRNGSDITDLSTSEGYASLPDESSIGTMSDISHFSENSEKELSQSVKSMDHLQQTRLENLNASVPVVKENNSTNEISQQPLSVQDILKDLEDAFNEIEPTTSDYSRSDRTFDDTMSNDHVLPAETRKNVPGRKPLYPIFYPKEKSHNTSKPEVREKQKSRSLCKTSLANESRQMMIDAGQKEFGAKECTSCGMVFEVGSEVDKSLHEQFHEMFTMNLKFPGWKKERVVGNYHDGRIIIVTKEDSNFKLRKVEDVLKVVNKNVGFSSDPGFPQRPNAMFLLFISNKTVVGCLVAESITHARRLILDTSVDVTSCSQEGEETASENWCASKKVVKALCGVNRIWVASEYRRKKIASRLLNCLRCNFIYGYTVSTKEIAFLDPSEDGRHFAAAYTKTSNFLVYK